MKDVRVTFSRRHAYATKSNVLKVVKTPGGRLVGAVEEPVCHLLVAQCLVSLPVRHGGADAGGEVLQSPDVGVLLTAHTNRPG